MYLNVSDVAAFIGQNKWDVVTPFERFWKNNDESFDVTLSKLKNDQGNDIPIRDTGLSSRQIVEKYIGADTTLKILEDDSLNHSQKKQKMTSLIPLNVETPSNISQTMHSLVNTEHGIKHEEAVIKIIEKEKKQIINRENKLYKKELMPDVVLCGRIDGLCDGYIVEVKNRMNGFFNSVRDYENTQVQLYMWMIEDVEYTNLEEHYQGKTKTTRIYKDGDYIEYVLDKLEVFCDNFTKFMNDQELKEAYLKKSLFDKTIVIKNMSK